MTVGEGAGIMVLETLDHARARNARVRAWLAGRGNTCDAHHASAPQPEGRGLLEAMRLALADAGLPPSAVGYVNAHGTGTTDNDLAEARAFRTLFGENIPAISSTKRFFGHAMAAAGAIEAIVSVLALEHQAIPPNLGLRKADPKIPITPVAEYRPASLDVSMSTSLGFGGNNSAVLFRRPGSWRDEG
jgi:3-oxoacyl-[acyl-carrier-protein] synthase II